MKNKPGWSNHILNFISVILGVYLAFYINERAKMNQDKKERLSILHSMIEDLSDDINTYEKYQIPQNKQHQKSIGSLLELLSKDNPDEVGEELGAIFQLENYAPTSSTYSSIKSSGKLSLIDDLALQKELSDFYEVIVLESIEKGEFQAEYFTDELLTWLTNNVDLLTLEVLNKDELVVLRNKLIIYESSIDQKVKSYEMIVEDSKSLISHIESNLKSR